MIVVGGCQAERTRGCWLRQIPQDGVNQGVSIQRVERSDAQEAAVHIAFVSRERAVGAHLVAILVYDTINGIL